MKDAYPLEDRDVSWLGFNARVLEEAGDPAVPLFERLFFLGVFSANLDEFFRVRVAGLRSLLRVGGGGDAEATEAARTLGRIQRTVSAQQEQFGRTFHAVRDGLAAAGVPLLDAASLPPEHAAFVRDYFDEHVRPLLEPVPLRRHDAPPFLPDGALHLVVELWPRAGEVASKKHTPDYALVGVPSGPLGRFVPLPPGEDGVQPVLFLDDVVRLNLPRLFEDADVGAAHAIKMSRDAELYVDEDGLRDAYGKALARRIGERLDLRETGLPCRLLYDGRAPFRLVALLKKRLGLSSGDLVLGGRYHHLSDLTGFPRFGRADLAFEPLPALAHPALDGARSLFDAARTRDHLLHYPYHRFGYAVRFLEEAAADPAVEAVWISLYRVASGSAIVDALEAAARAGKRVTAFVEAKARFDEARNLAAAERLEAAGARVLYSRPKLKVHAKMALVQRREGRARKLYAYFSTGNFNERTATVYADTALLTSDARLTKEARRVFAHLAGRSKAPAFEHLLVAPFGLRDRLYGLIEDEIRHAKAGEDAWIVLKVNALEDGAIIRRLYEASQAGVRIRVVVRGICRLVPGVPGLSETVEVRRLVGRFLEHARVYAFCAGGAEPVYLASADWMKRNLSRRVEVAFPLYDDALRAEVRALVDLQLRDTAKARRLGPAGASEPLEGPPFDAQRETYRALAARVEAPAS